MKENKVINILTAFIAVILSIVFISTIIATVTTASICAFVKPENIVDIMQSIDYTEILSGVTKDTEYAETPENLDTEAIIGNNNLMEESEAQLINDIIKSDAAKQLMDEYFTSFTAAMTGKETSDVLTEEKVLAIVEENIDELVEIAKEYTNEEVDEEELRTEINQLVKENAGDIVEALPEFEEVAAQLDSNTLRIIGKIASSGLTYILTTITVILALLIYACRYKRFGGFMWIGVDCIIAGCLVAVVKFAFTLAKTLVLQSMDETTMAIASPVIFSMNKTFNIALAIIGLVAIASIALFTILRKAAKKKKAEAPEMIPAAEVL